MPRFPDGVRHRGIVDVIGLLTEWGASVDMMYPEEQTIGIADIRVEHDLYVLKSRTEIGLAYAGALHAAGATILNPYPAAALIRDKIALMAMLHTTGVPVPEAFITAQPAQLSPLLAAGPLVVKPYRGSGTGGVHVVRDAEDLDDVPRSYGPLFAQRLIDGHPAEREIYCLGNQVFGVKRSSSPRTDTFTVSPRLRAIVQLCATALGIDAFSIDVLGNDDTPHVVDVTSFPTFTGFPDAALRVADYIFDTALRALHHRHQNQNGIT